jgi:hypothetical protein
MRKPLVWKPHFVRTAIARIGYAVHGVLLKNPIPRAESRWYWSTRAWVFKGMGRKKESCWFWWIICRHSFIILRTAEVNIPTRLSTLVNGRLWVLTTYRSLRDAPQEMNQRRFPEAHLWPWHNLWTNARWTLIAYGTVVEKGASRIRVLIFINATSYLFIEFNSAARIMEHGAWQI